jgi:hypothetical protein
VRSTRSSGSEADLIPQFAKLALKRRSGADNAITQVGYDVRRRGHGTSARTGASPDRASASQLGRPHGATERADRPSGAYVFIVASTIAGLEILTGAAILSVRAQSR